MGHLSTTTTCGIVLALFSAGLLFTGGETVRIKNFRVPEVVQNGSEPSVILDCDYSVDKNSAGLVVKWFFNNDPQPVYQWIPNRKPQDLGVLKGKLNLDYRASDDENTKYRALQILRPTTELSGEYKCLVSTYDDEDSATKKMVIFVPERTLELKQNKPQEDRVTVSCVAEGVYPEPNMTLRTDPPSLLERVPAMWFTYETKNTAEGLYDISTTVTVEDREFKSETKFECELKIPEANYTVKRSFVYSPGPPSTTSTSTELPSTESPSNESFLATDDNINGSKSIHHHWVFTAICFIFSLLRL